MFSSPWNGSRLPEGTEDRRHPPDSKGGIRSNGVFPITSSGSYPRRSRTLGETYVYSPSRSTSHTWSEIVSTRFWNFSRASRSSWSARRCSVMSSRTHSRFVISPSSVWIGVTVVDSQ